MSIIKECYDIDIFVMEKMDDESLINFCRACNYQEACTDEFFWKQRFISKYGLDNAKFILLEKEECIYPPVKIMLKECNRLEKVSWKDRYLSVYTYSSKYTYGVCLGKVVKRGYSDLTNFFIKIGLDTDLHHYSEALCHWRVDSLLKENNFAMIQMYKENGIKIHRRYMSYIACKSGNESQINFIYNLPHKKEQRSEEIYYENGIFGAARGGHLNLLKKLEVSLKNIINENYNFDQLWDNAINFAAQSNNMEVINYIINEKCNNKCDWDIAIYGAAKKGNLDLIHFFIDKYKTYGFSIKDSKIPFFNRGPSINWNYGMEGASEGGHLDVIQFFIQQGAKDWKRCLEKSKHRLIIQFFENLIDAEKLIHND